MLKVIDLENLKKFNFLLPIIERNNAMNFYRWKSNDLLFLNKFGIPEPYRSKKIIPSVILVPLLAFDKEKNRLGYGKGYYDRFLKKNKKITTIGVAFSFQRYNKITTSIHDVKLEYILTEKGII